MKNRITFKEGDRVFDIVNGWGEVTYLYNFDWEKLALEHLACIIKFDNGKECHYTKYVALRLLSFTEYGFDERFTQERSFNYDDYIGKWGKFWDTAYENTVIIAKLSSYLLRDGYRSFRCYTVGEDRETGYTNFESLTEEQLKVLGL
jgi:hypothetical protein